MFCTQNGGENPTFQVDLWSQKVMSDCLIFANIVSKYLLDFKEKVMMRSG